jgi:dimethylargininase
MITALTRAPGPDLARCELTHLARQPIEPALALDQHRAYQAALRNAGVHVLELPADPAQPDGVFVEDAAVVLDEVAILSSPTPPSRRGEIAAVAAALCPFRRLERLPPGAFLEGGDVLRLGQNLFVGMSGRTSDDGIRALDGIVTPLGYTIVPVRVMACLHLKSAVCGVDEEVLLVNREWVETNPFCKFRLVNVPAEEPSGANVLRLPGVVLASSAFPKTADLIGGLGLGVKMVDVSELHKAESGMSCMSLVFEAMRVEPRRRPS